MSIWCKMKPLVARNAVGGACVSLAEGGDVACGPMDGDVGLVGRAEAEMRDGCVKGHETAAGLDFALALAAVLRGEETAKSIQLGMEYAPAPPFTDGHPSVADRTIVEKVKELQIGECCDFPSPFRADVVEREI